MTNLLVVESPAKAKTIGKYLGKDYEVVASFGHVRDLPSKPGSVDTKNDFDILYEVSAKSTKHVKDIVDKMKKCNKLILAPDPDREGESIAWHILEVLKKKKVVTDKTPVERVVFNAITKNSVTQAINNPRQIDMDLVNAQQARRALDYLVGFTLSPVLWRKLPGSRSAGRVQSVALRIICDREDEIDAFKSEEYWDVKVDLKGGDSKQNITANLTHIGGDRLEKFSITNEKQAQEISSLLENRKYQVTDVKRKETKRRPYAPFTTSSMQQEASRKLGFSAKKTMQIAQRLYEGVEVNGSVSGLITYMRTDGVYVIPEMINAARNFIKNEYGDRYVPVAPIMYQNKVKNAQEAHEAIRPTDFLMSPKNIAHSLDKDQLSLYRLIWNRMVASQMADVIMDQVTVTIKTNPDYGLLRATGSVVKFDGFYVLYNEGKDDEEDDDEEKKLPNVKEGDDLSLLAVKPAQHFTEPPPRFGEASLVKKMEELGIGRPSTYASIISVLQDRDYVKLETKRFFPEERGRVVTVFLKEFFSTYVEYDYTAKLEDELDIISNGKMAWKQFLHNFWGDFDKNIESAMQKTIPEVMESLNAKMAAHIFGFNDDGTVKNKCTSCDDGILGIKLGKFGVFVGCSNYPTCKNTKQIAQGDGDAEQASGFEPKSLGRSEEFGGEVFVKKGPYGVYLELIKDKVVEDVPPEAEVVKKVKSKPGTKSKAKAKVKKTKKPSAPKRVSVPKDIALDEVSIELAQKLLSLPREVGNHPESGLKIVASIGPFGPYLLHDKKYASVKEDDILEIGLNRAVTVIAEDLAKKEARGNKKSFKKKKVDKKKK